MIGNLVQIQTCKQTLMCKIITQLLIRTKETRKTCYINALFINAYD